MCGSAPPQALRWLSARLVQHFAATEQQAAAAIVLVRRHDCRALANHDAALAAIAELAPCRSAERLEALSFRDQCQLFRAARVVVRCQREATELKASY